VLRKLFVLCYLAVSLASLFTNRLPFPFVQYQMFHRTVPAPSMELYRVEALAPSGKREVLPQTFFRPMSLREVYEVFRYRPRPMSEALGRRALERAKEHLPEYRDFVVVEQRCDCQAFYVASPRRDPLSFAAESCQQRPVSAVLP